MSPSQKSSPKMNAKKLSEEVSVSPQIMPADIAAIAAQGFKTIVCNRPDGEGTDQPLFAEIEAAARAAGLSVRYIPVSTGKVTDEDAAAFGDALSQMPKPVLAYCRTGTRSTTLWALSEGGRRPAAEIAERAKAAGWEFEPEALKLLAAYVQPSSREIAGEIDKIILYASSKRQGNTIKAADIYDCVGISKTYNVFELEKAVASRNLRLSSGISIMIMDREGQKEGLGSIVRYLTTFFMRLWKLSAPAVRQLPPAEIARILGMYGKQEFFVRNYLGYTGAFSPEQTVSAMLALRETDAALKGLIPYPDERFLLLRLMQKLLG